MNRGTLASISGPESTTLAAHSAFTVRRIVFARRAGDRDACSRSTASCRYQIRRRWTGRPPDVAGDLDERQRGTTTRPGDLPDRRPNRFAGVVGCAPTRATYPVMPLPEEPRAICRTGSSSTHREPLLRRRARPRTSCPARDSNRDPPAVLKDAQGGRRTIASFRPSRISTRRPPTTTARLDARHGEPVDARDAARRGLPLGEGHGVAAIRWYRARRRLPHCRRQRAPGYAWSLGRDSAWTTLASTAAGAFDTTRSALEFLRKTGRSAWILRSRPRSIPWLANSGYPWASADATPLYVAIANAEGISSTTGNHTCTSTRRGRPC